MAYLLVELAGEYTVPPALDGLESQEVGMASLQNEILVGIALNR